MATPLDFLPQAATAWIRERYCWLPAVGGVYVLASLLGFHMPILVSEESGPILSQDAMAILAVFGVLWTAGWLQVRHSARSGWKRRQTRIRRFSEEALALLRRAKAETASEGWAKIETDFAGLKKRITRYLDKNGIPASLWDSYDRPSHRDIGGRQIDAEWLFLQGFGYASKNSRGFQWNGSTGARDLAVHLCHFDYVLRLLPKYYEDFVLKHESG